MSLLLDTHAAIWWWLDSPMLGSKARESVSVGEQQVFVSAVSGIEIAIKFRIGKLPEFGDPSARFPALMRANDFDSLPITQSHALAAGLLVGEYRDPFDRLIAAQALEEKLIVVTRDPAFAAFGCKVLW